MNKHEIIEKLNEASDILADIKDALEEINEEIQFDYVTSPKLADVNDLVFRQINDINRIVYQGN